MKNATFSINEQYHGIEISFDGKPSEMIRSQLKTSGFRWHNVRKIWYARQTAERLELAKQITGATEAAETITTPAAQEVNAYGVQVGDIFRATWGYEQTNNDFFQVVRLAGKSSVYVREVYPEVIGTQAYTSMSEDRTLRLTREILPPVERSIFIKNQEAGDIKRLQGEPGHVYIKISGYAVATLCEAETMTVYNSWYA